MLEPTEPTEGSEELNTPSDTLPPRRRRRAASRPAGPPVAAAGAPEEITTPAIPAAGADDLVAEEVSVTEEVKEDEEAAEVVEAAETAETSGTDVTAEEPEAPARTRRRATRRASAPAGAPASAEAAEVAETVVPAAPAPASQKATAPAAEQSEAVASDEDAAPPRTRRRATRRVSAPAAAPTSAETAETAVPAASAEGAGEAAAVAQESEPVEAPAVAEVAETPAEDTAPRRTRRRATRRVAAPVADTSVAGGTDAETSAAAENAESPVSADTAGQGTGGAAAPEAVAAPEASASRTPEAPVAQGDDDASPRRARRRVVRRAAVGFSEPARSGEAGEDEGPRRPARPAVAVFQAPVFTEPQFQTPQRAAAAAAAEAAEVVDEVEELPEEQPEEQPAGTRRRRRRRGETAEVETPAVVEDDETEEAEESAEGAADGEDEAEETGSRRRRRRGGRRRRRGDSAEAGGEDESEESDELAAEQAAQDAEDTAEQEEEDDDEAHDEAGGSSSSSRRRRRRRRRAGDSSVDTEPGEGDPERTVVKVREPRKPSEPSDEVQSIKGSTRLEAKKQRRREGREQGRRRVPIITEAEFLARREAVERVMVVRQSGERTQIGVLEDGVLVEHYVNKEQSTSYVGNVYLGKVQNVLPSMEAAFIDIGKGRNAVLYAGEVNFEALGMANGPRRIESALKSGQSVLVQVTKDPIGHKGARLTSQVSLPGRYLVYVPEGSMTGISRKLPDTERARLKTILKKIVPEDAGVIVRTAAEGASEDELRRDVERLQAQWEEIQKKSKNGNAPTLLYGEPDMTVRVVRDIFNEDFSKVIVSGDEAWQTVHGYVSHVAPDLAERLQKWTSEVDVFATYRIDEQLAKALDRKVWLPSGGSLVIDRTEAMVVIDVNTGKFTGQGGNLEETVTRNNLEAAEEIVRQLRLRDLGGIIVIDFIDMVLESNRDLVLRRLLECLGRDRTKHQVAEVTSLGLVQMTRKRVGQGLLESFSETCVHCNGRGVIVHMEQPSSAGGGGKRKKRGRGGDGHEQEHVHETAAVVVESGEAVEPEIETAAEIAAEAAEPVALPAPVFEPDEELYSSVAEAEAAVSRGGRTRRRSSRRASAPAGAPQGRTRPETERSDAADGRGAGRSDAVKAASDTEVADVPTAQAVPAEVEAERPVQPETATEAQARPVAAEDPVVGGEPAEEAAPKGRTRRRATRKVSAPAGSPAGAEAAVVTVSETVAAPAAEAPAAAEQEAEVPAESAAPARPRRRAVRKETAPTAPEETAVVVVPSATEAPAAGEGAEDTAPARKTARKTAKKATAKKAATKKTVAKKTAAKKTAAKKTTAKKAAKKTAAAEQQPVSSVSTAADEG
ncbi:Rne/Rng family ribonuclease [Streptomyces sp. NPDC002144]